MPLTTIYDGGTRIVGDATALEESLHPAVMAYVNAMSSPTGGNYAMTVNEIDAVNNMVKAMVANGIWSKMKAVYPIIGGTAAAHKYNLVDPRDNNAAYRLTFTAGWTHDANQMKPNGTSAYANTFFNPFLNQTTSNGHLSAYCREINTSLSINIGVSTTVGSTDICDLYYGGSAPTQAIFRWGAQSPGTIASQSILDSRGFFVGSITAATASSRVVYRNSVGASATNYGSPVMPNANFYLGALNATSVGSGGALHSPRPFSFASIGDGLTATEAKAFSTIVQAYQTKLGRQV